MIRCKDKLEVMQFGILTDEYQCTLPAEHPGNHVGQNKTQNTVTWGNTADLRRRVEHEYKPLNGH